MPTQKLGMAAMFAGALLAITIVLLYRPFMHGDLFMAGVCGGWLGYGLLGFVRAEVSLRGRHGPAKTWGGAEARLIALIIVVMAGSFMYCWTEYFPV